MKLDTKDMLSATRLLEELFPDPESRPSIRWLWKQKKNRVIPYCKIGHLVFFNLEKVRDALAKKNFVRAL